MIIAMACNENWYKYLTVNLYSLLKCIKKIKKIYLLLETDKIEEVKDLEKVIKKYPVNIKLIGNFRLKYPVQYALNLICQHKTLYIPSMHNYVWNVTKEVKNNDLIKVSHYAGPKEQWVVDRFYAELWYDVEEQF